MARKILSTLLCVVLLATSVVMVGAVSTDVESAGADNVYSTASQKLDDEYGYNGTDLGATYTPEATTFKLWSPTATDVKLNLYTKGSDGEEGAAKISTTQMTVDKGVWSVKIDGDIKNKYYTYTVKTPDVLGKNEKTYETQDPYSVATGVNGMRSMVCDLDSTNPTGWDKDAHVLLDRNTESFVWEVHVKDFSYAKNSGVSDANRGKYLAFTETGTTLNNEGKIATCIDYLKKLGVTTVQINPFYDFNKKSVDESGSDSQFNWGYDPVNYNVPDGSYSSNPYDGNVRINECKQMVKALHDAGIGVVMDVVYNHTFDTETSFQYTVPNYYYRMNTNGSFSNGSGCGNETASERLMFRNFMINSCLYWVNEYHIDGFRFDLMALHDTETMNLIREALDKVDPRITVWGEGWTGGTSNHPTKTCTGANFRQCSQAAAMGIDSRIGFFNDQIRDGLKGSVFNKKAKGFLQTAGIYNEISAGVKANPTTWRAQTPSQVVTYDSCHDNQTLWDRLADSQGYTDFRKREPLLVAESKMAGGMLNMSQGVTFVLAGEEMGRSKDNDANSYKTAATLNMIDWSLAQSNADIVSYYAGMREIRSHFSALTVDERKGFSFTDTPVNPTYNGQTLTNCEGYAAVWTNPTEGEWDKLAVIVNNQDKELVYTLDNAVKDWVVIADDQQAGVTKLAEVKNGEFKLPAMSMIVAVDKTSFDAVKVTSKRGCSVKVKAINEINNSVMDEYTITGLKGDAYVVSEPAVGTEYELVRKEGNLSGVFADDTQEVVLYYSYYAPESVKGADLDGNGKVNINDATYIQKAIAGKITLTDAQKKLADTNLDGDVNINDVTMIQKYLAHFSVATGTVTVNYYMDGTSDSIISSTVYEGRVGETYVPKPGKALGYAVNTDKLPKSEVLVPFGNAEVNYYYVTASRDVTLYVKHSSGSGYNPILWIWGMSDGDDSGTNYCTSKVWPGDTLTGKSKDINGWYKKQFTADEDDDAYNFIVSDNANGQSIDCKGFIQNELWIVIDDAKDGVNLAAYDVNPDNNKDAEPIFTT